MNGGEIRNNTAAYGAAISDGGYGAAIVEIHGGKITGNTGKGTESSGAYGGAIKNGGSGSLTITDGEITGNSAPNGRGGGIYTAGSNFTITGGRISGNTAREENLPLTGSGHNIFVNKVTFTLGGAADLPDGLFLQPGTTNPPILISSALQNDVEIEGIYDFPKAGDVVAAGTDGYTITEDDVKKLSYQDSRFGFALDTENNQIKLANT